MHIFLKKCAVEELFGLPADYQLECDAELLAELSEAPCAKSPYKNLIAELAARNITYRQFAELMGLKMSSIVRKMRGERNFTVKDKAKLVEIFGKPIEYLLKREPYENPAKARREDSPYKNLLKELDARHMSYRDLAKLLGVSHSNVACKMRGERNFTVKDKAKLIEIFGKPIEYLLARDDT